MTHPNEPSLEVLKQIRKQLVSAPSTDENVKKLHAVSLQIERAESRSREKVA